MNRGFARRLATTVLAAAVGALAGQLAARRMLPPEVVRNSQLPAMYGTAGALIAILSMRLATVIRTVITDYRRNRRR